MTQILTAGQATSTRGGQISRDEVISRAQNWADRHDVTYNMQASASDLEGAHTYRCDCSGLVSMAWHYGSIPSTDQFMDKARRNDGMHSIAFDDLQPGDAMVKDPDGGASTAGHIELFSHWVNAGNHGQGAYVYSFNHNGETVRNPYRPNNRGLPGLNDNDEMRSYTMLIRYNNIVDASLGDVPVAGDFDGDGATEVGIWRPAEGTFHLRGRDGSLTKVSWGGPGDIPVIGDWDGDGRDDVGIFRPSEGRFHLAGPSGATYVSWGGPGDIPVAGDFDGDGRDEPAIWRPNEGRFHVPGGPTGIQYVSWGGAGDIPVIGDWDGDGRDDVGIFRPSEGRFHLAGPSGATYVSWGASGDIPVAGNFDGIGGVNVGIWRPSEARFHLCLDNGAVSYLDWGARR